MAKNINQEERINIQTLNNQDITAPEIARYLNRNKTTIYCELSKRS